MSTFGDRLKEMRKTTKLTVAEFIELIEVPYNTYYGWTHQGSMPKKETIDRVAKALDVSPEWLLGKDEKKQEVKKSSQTKVTKIPFDPKDEPNPTSSSVFVPASKPYEAKIEEKIYSRKDGIRYYAEDEKRLQDVNTIISEIKNMDIPRDKKKRIHKTMSEFRIELECKVLYGDDARM